MSDERDLLEKTSTETTKEIDTGKDWKLAIEDLNAHMLEEAPNMIDVVRRYYLDIAHSYETALEQATASGEEKKLRSFMRREMKKSFVSDIKIGHRLLEWERNLDRPQETEKALNTIFSEVGLKVGFGLLEKLPDTYTKPNVRVIDTERRRQVAIAILDELVAEVQVANKTDPKNDLVPARIGHLVKTFSLPEVGDRVEFDKTMRGVVVEHVDGEGEALDGAIVRIDNSGEEKLVLRGQKKFTEEPIARLHEAAIVRGDNVELYGQTVVVQNYEPGDSEQVEALRLDGTVVKLPARDLVRAKPKNAKVVGDLLHLVSEKGHLDKIELAVEHAEKPLFKQIEELRATAEASYEDGQIFAASRLSEIQPEVFVGAFTAMPSDKQAIVLSQIVPKAPPPPLDSEWTIEIQGTTATPQPEAESAPDQEIVKEAQAEVATEDTTVEEVEQPITSQPESETIETAPIEVQAETFTEVEIDHPVEAPEPELDGGIIKKAEEILKAAFNTYRANHKLAQTRKNNEPLPESPIATFQTVIENNSEVKTFLAHSAGCHFLAVIASEPWAAIVDYIKGHWSDLNTDAICDRIQSASTEVYEAAELYRVGSIEAIKPLDLRLKVAAQYGCLSKEERLVIGKNGKTIAEKVASKTETKTKVKTEKQTPKVETSAVHPVVRASANINEIRDWLLTSTFLETAVGLIKGYELKLEEIISSEQLQTFAEQSREKANHVAQILKMLNREDYLNIPVSDESKVSIVSASICVQETNNNQDEEYLGDIGF